VHENETIIGWIDAT